jgi:hypothetical protein
MFFPADLIRGEDTLFAKLAFDRVWWLWLDAIVAAEIFLPVDALALVTLFIF